MRENILVLLLFNKISELAKWDEDELIGDRGNPCLFLFFYKTSSKLRRLRENLSSFIFVLFENKGNLKMYIEIVCYVVSSLTDKC